VVVDDWPLVRMGLGALLQEAGVGVAGNSDRGGEGVRLAAQSGAELLVLGAHTDLPSGAAARRAKALPSKVRLLVLYGRADRSEIVSLLRFGVEGLVGRLSPPQELQAAVRRVLAGERVVAGAAVAVLADAASPQRAASAEPVDATGPLTAQEGRILDRLAVGLSNAEIAVELSVSVATVKTHLSNLYGKLDARNRREAVTRGIDLGLVGLGRS